MMLHLDNYLESLESLPGELDRNFALLRDLDKRTYAYLAEIGTLKDNYLKTCRNLKPHERKKICDKIDDLYKAAKDLCEDKVQLSMQTYEMVDKHIRKLDSDLARFEEEMTSDPSLITNMDGAFKKKRRKAQSDRFEKKRGRGKKIDDEGPKKKKSKISAAPICDAVSLVSLPHPSDVLDMPVDPNEPTYCICHQVSYGEMIGCDNPDCLIEWFHFGCVNLETKPKGKWYCPKCSIDKKKK